MLDLSSITNAMQPKTMAARDWVFHVIRSAIVQGVLPGGMPLRQDEISESLSVSHIPVREALRQLEAQGLVRIYPNRGAVVTKLTAQELSNIMDIRIMLELGALKNALHKIDKIVIEKAREIYELSLIENDYNRLEELNLKLHFTLYQPADNPELMQLIDQFHANVDRYIRPYYSDIKLHKSSLDEHLQLINACERRDVGLATAVLRTHLEQTKNMLMNSPVLN